MKQAKDYLVFPLDFSTLKEAQSFVDRLAADVGMFKIGLELFIEQGPAAIQMVRDHSDARIFLDLKLHDISKTVERAMARVAHLGVDLVTVHCSSSIQMLEQAVKGGQGRTGVLGVTLLTDNDAVCVEASGFKDIYVRDPGELVMKRAQMAFDAKCSGVVCSGQEVRLIKSRFGKTFLAVTPGIRPAFSILENDDQKRVTTPAQAIRDGSDLLVIGRPIKMAADPEGAAAMILDEIRSAVDEF
ncbi:MAG: orotidine-5'-phosphate decarboxylase [Desulfobacteraceae bacterium]|nr:MAG: orotidine-5'-phosphate decarboxylase [Desulfobacteraceae bacterium]